MNEHDPIGPIDRLLDDAFRSRSVPPVSRPSVIDVQYRARRRQHRRSGAMLGALAVVGVGGAIAVAARHDSSDRIALTPGGTQAGVATTVACFTVPTTMWIDVAPTIDPATNSSPAPSPTTYPPDTTSPVGYLPGDPCAPSSGGSYHCTGPLGTYSDGAQMFSECVFWPDFMPATTSFDPAITVPPTGPPTTYTECPPKSNCVPGFPFDSTTTTSLEVSPNSFVPCDFPPVTSPVTTTCDSGAVVPLVVPPAVVVPTSALVTSTTSLP